MDALIRQRVKAEARVRLTADVLGHVELRRGQARMRGDADSERFFDALVRLFQGFLAEERNRLAALSEGA